MTDEAANLTVARTELLGPMAPPASTVGLIGWARHNLFNGWLNTLLTIVSLYLVWLILVPLIRFLLIDAVWEGTSREDCLAEKVGREVGACWPFVRAKFTQLVYGFYPWDQHWRVNLTLLVGAVLLLPLLIPRIPYKTLNAILFFGVYPVFAFFLLVGGKLEGFALTVVLALLEGLYRALFALADLPLVGILFTGLANLVAIVTYPIRMPLAFVLQPPYGLWNDLVITAVLTAGLVARVKRPPARIPAIGWTLAVFVAIGAVIRLIGFDVGLPVVETRAWGGLLVTLVVAVTGIVASLPLGILLALGRRSQMPIVRTLSVLFIEFWRGVPLITVLFFATYMLPLFLPANWTIDALLRALVGVALFSAAYMAEVVRGGLQAIPRGQYEGAMALGLGYWKMMAFIVLPQALKLVIPGIVNNFIGLFKDTTLVMIVSIFDFLGQLRAAFSDPNWGTPVTLFTGFAFAGIVYFVFCFGMSRYSLALERRLSTGHRR
jgi:general L-amino acid transport system permease protein